MPAKVIVIGNVIAGGAGKTPTLLAIAEYLVQNGESIGVISRGYGRRSNDIREVFPYSDPLDVGDEPLLIRRRLSVPVIVGSSRVDAARQLLTAYPKVEVILSDDGLQHLSLFRDIEIYVFDDRGIGNGLPLPAGPLRSAWPPSFVVPAGQSENKHLVLHTGSRPVFGGYTAKRRLASYGVTNDGTKITLKQLQNTANGVIAVAAIAMPEIFFQMLSDSGIETVGNFGFPDHWDFATWKHPRGGDCTILCTEKDAAKLWQHEPKAIAIPLIQELESAFVQRIGEILRESDIRP
jgi:tetraacyldisaccharide 4'-kinase